MYWRSTLAQHLTPELDAREPSQREQTKPNVMGHHLSLTAVTDMHHGQASRSCNNDRDGMVTVSCRRTPWPARPARMKVLGAAFPVRPQPAAHS